MASKKYYMTIETKEDFEKLFNKIYNSGKDDGFKKGIEVGLAQFLRTINARFDDDMIRNASYIANEMDRKETMRKINLNGSSKNENT